jgi:hypothetical protein
MAQKNLDQAVLDKAREHYNTRKDRRPKQVWNDQTKSWEKTDR